MNLTNLLLFAVLLATLILVHELGHYLAAKLFRVKVLTFSIGFGPKLLGFRWGETEYQLSALPLGGYVKMAGDDPSEPLPEADKGRGFLEQAAWKRALIAFAGPAMNLVFPVLAYFIAFSMTGSDYAPLVATVYPDQPAYAAGLRPGDRITAVEGQPIRYFSELQEAVRPRAELETTVTYLRGGRELTAKLVPSRLERKTILGKEVRGLIGIGLTARAPIVAVPRADSPAAKAGLQTFDRIVKVGQTPRAGGGALPGEGTGRDHGGARCSLGPRGGRADDVGDVHRDAGADRVRRFGRARRVLKDGGRDDA